MTKAIAAIVLGVASLGLVPQPASAQGAKPPDGYHTVTVKKAGFSIAVPDTWLVLDGTAKGFRKRLQKAAEANPKLAPYLEQLDLVHVKLYAADATNPDYSDNVTVFFSGYDK